MPTRVVRGGKMPVVTNPGPFFPANPWIGADRRLLLDLRGGIDGPPGARVPDAPPPTAAQISALERERVAHVVEGYRAVYLSANDVTVVVSAIRFDSASLAATPSRGFNLHASQGVSDRLVVGAVVVRVRASSMTDCFRAVDAHIRALK